MIVSIPTHQTIVTTTASDRYPSADGSEEKPKEGSWSTPLIVGNHVYVTNLDGAVLVFNVSAEQDLVSQQNMEIPMYSTPIVANGVLYVATFNKLFAIAAGAQSKPAGADSK